MTANVSHHHHFFNNNKKTFVYQWNDRCSLCSRCTTSTHSRTHMHPYDMHSHNNKSEKTIRTLLTTITCVMRCVHARKQNIKTNETFCCCFFHLVIRVKPIGMESSTSIFLRKTKIPRSHRKQCTKKAEKLVSFSMFDLRSENKKQKKITYPTAIKCYYGILGYGESFDVMRLFHFSAIRLPIYGLLRSTTITTTTAITHHHSKCYWNIYHSTKHTRARARFCTLAIHTI